MPVKAARLVKLTWRTIEVHRLEKSMRLIRHTSQINIDPFHWVCRVCMFFPSQHPGLYLKRDAA